MVKNKVSENRFDSILDLGQRNCSLYVEIGLYLGEPISLNVR